MKGSLDALMSAAIDYAGMFPPAKLALADAVSEYLDLRSGANSWIVDHFVVGSSKLVELEAELRLQASQRDKMPAVTLSLVGSPLEDGASASKTLDRDIARIQDSTAKVEAYEVKVPSDTHLNSCLRAIKKSGLLDLDIPVYLEFPWNSDMSDAIYEAVSVLEEIGFKARTGGTEATAFPTVQHVADFIVNMASLDMPFKFTAGLHEPLRYDDSELIVTRHGFLNVMLASALALTQDLNHKEITEVLELTDPKQITFGDEHIQALGFQIEPEDLEDFWQSFGGFGSCSIEEPIAGLKRLGYL